MSNRFLRLAALVLSVLFSFNSAVQAVPFSNGISRSVNIGQSRLNAMMDMIEDPANNPGFKKKMRLYGSKWKIACLDQSSWVDRIKYMKNSLSGARFAQLRQKFEFIEVCADILSSNLYKKEDLPEFDSEEFKRLIADETKKHRLDVMIKKLLFEENLEEPLQDIAERRKKIGIELINLSDKLGILRDQKKNIIDTLLKIKEKKVKNYSSALRSLNDVNLKRMQETLKEEYDSALLQNESINQEWKRESVFFDILSERLPHISRDSIHNASRDSERLLLSIAPAVVQPHACWDEKKYIYLPRLSELSKYAVIFELGAQFKGKSITAKAVDARFPEIYKYIRNNMDRWGYTTWESFAADVKKQAKETLHVMSQDTFKLKVDESFEKLKISSFAELKELSPEFATIFEIMHFDWGVRSVGSIFDGSGKRWTREAYKTAFMEAYKERGITSLTDAKDSEKYKHLFYVFNNNRHRWGDFDSLKDEMGIVDRSQSLSKTGLDQFMKLTLTFFFPAYRNAYKDFSETNFKALKNAYAKIEAAYKRIPGIKNLHSMTEVQCDVVQDVEFVMGRLNDFFNGIQHKTPEEAWRVIVDFFDERVDVYAEFIRLKGMTGSSDFMKTDGESDEYDEYSDDEDDFVSDDAKSKKKRMVEEELVKKVSGIHYDPFYKRSAEGLNKRFSQASKTADKKKALSEVKEADDEIASLLAEIKLEVKRDDLVSASIDRLDSSLRKLSQAQVTEIAELDSYAVFAKKYRELNDMFIQLGRFWGMHSWRDMQSYCRLMTDHNWTKADFLRCLSMRLYAYPKVKSLKDLEKDEPVLVDVFKHRKKDWQINDFAQLLFMVDMFRFFNELTQQSLFIPRLAAQVRSAFFAENEPLKVSILSDCIDDVTAFSNRLSLLRYSLVSNSDDLKRIVDSLSQLYQVLGKDLKRLIGQSDSEKRELFRKDIDRKMRETSDLIKAGVYGMKAIIEKNQIPVRKVMPLDELSFSAAVGRYVEFKGDVSEDELKKISPVFSYFYSPFMKAYKLADIDELKDYAKEKSESAELYLDLLRCRQIIHGGDYKSAGIMLTHLMDEVIDIIESRPVEKNAASEVGEQLLATIGMLLDNHQASFSEEVLFEWFGQLERLYFACEKNPSAQYFAFAWEKEIISRIHLLTGRLMARDFDLRTVKRVIDYASMFAGARPSNQVKKNHIQRIIKAYMNVVKKMSVSSDPDFALLSEISESVINLYSSFPGRKSYSSDFVVRGFCASAKRASEAGNHVFAYELLMRTGEFFEKNYSYSRKDDLDVLVSDFFHQLVDNGIYLMEKMNLNNLSRAVSLVSQLQKTFVKKGDGYLLKSLIQPYNGLINATKAKGAGFELLIDKYEDMLDVVTQDELDADDLYSVIQGGVHVAEYWANSGDMQKALKAAIRVHVLFDFEKLSSLMLAEDLEKIVKDFFGIYYVALSFSTDYERLNHVELLTQQDDVIAHMLLAIMFLDYRKRVPFEVKLAKDMDDIKGLPELYASVNILHKALQSFNLDGESSIKNMQKFIKRMKKPVKPVFIETVRTIALGRVREIVSERKAESQGGYFRLAGVFMLFGLSLAGFLYLDQLLAFLGSLESVISLWDNSKLINLGGGLAALFTLSMAGDFGFVSSNAMKNEGNRPGKSTVFDLPMSALNTVRFNQMSNMQLMEALQEVSNIRNHDWRLFNSIVRKLKGRDGLRLIVLGDLVNKGEGADLDIVYPTEISAKISTSSLRVFNFLSSEQKRVVDQFMSVHGPRMLVFVKESRDDGDEVLHFITNHRVDADEYAQLLNPRLGDVKNELVMECLSPGSLKRYLFQDDEKSDAVSSYLVSRSHKKMRGTHFSFYKKGKVSPFSDDNDKRDFPVGRVQGYSVYEKIGEETGESEVLVTDAWGRTIEKRVFDSAEFPSEIVVKGLMSNHEYSFKVKSSSLGTIEYDCYQNARFLGTINFSYENDKVLLESCSIPGSKSGEDVALTVMNWIATFAYRRGLNIELSPRIRDLNMLIAFERVTEDAVADLNHDINIYDNNAEPVYREEKLSDIIKRKFPVGLVVGGEEHSVAKVLIHEDKFLVPQKISPVVLSNGLVTMLNNDNLMFWDSRGRRKRHVSVIVPNDSLRNVKGKPKPLIPFYNEFGGVGMTNGDQTFNARLSQIKTIEDVELYLRMSGHAAALEGLIAFRRNNYLSFSSVANIVPKLAYYRDIIRMARAKKIFKLSDLSSEARDKYLVLNEYEKFCVEDKKDILFDALAWAKGFTSEKRNSIFSGAVSEYVGELCSLPLYRIKGTVLENEDIDFFKDAFSSYESVYYRLLKAYRECGGSIVVGQKGEFEGLSKPHIRIPIDIWKRAVDGDELSKFKIFYRYILEEVWINGPVIDLASEAAVEQLIRSTKDILARKDVRFHDKPGFQYLISVFKDNPKAEVFIKKLAIIMYTTEQLFVTDNVLFYERLNTLLPDFDDVGQMRENIDFRYKIFLMMSLERLRLESLASDEDFLDIIKEVGIIAKRNIDHFWDMFASALVILRKCGDHASFQDELYVNIKSLVNDKVWHGQKDLEAELNAAMNCLQEVSDIADLKLKVKVDRELRESDLHDFYFVPLINELSGAGVNIYFVEDAENADIILSYEDKAEEYSKWNEKLFIFSNNRRVAVKEFLLFQPFFIWFLASCLEDKEFNIDLSKAKGLWTEKKEQGAGFTAVLVEAFNDALSEYVNGRIIKSAA